MHTIDAVSFEEAWTGRFEAVMTISEGDIAIPYIGLADLVRNKRAVGRPKDLDDLTYLSSAL